MLDKALKEFEATLEKERNRFRSLHGTARAATLLGNRVAARRYYDRLLKICARTDKPGRADLVETRLRRHDLR